MGISNRHTVNLFVAGKSAPLSGQRLAKIGYKKLSEKARKEGAKEFKSVCVSVPQIDVENDPFVAMRNSGVFNSIIQTALCAAQDGIIRSLYESSDGTRKEIDDSEISIESCLAFIEAESTGSRLSAALIEGWFSTQIKEPLIVTVAEKLGFNDMTDAQLITIHKHVENYKKLFQSLAGKGVILEEKQLHGLRKAIEVADCEDDETSKKIIAKIEGMLKKEKIEDLLEL
jgi:hypothetical protein